ncbi:M1 family metallopeptidase [Cryobacterium sp. PAMC25264]|uniref:M1 family metallopeptidase n=1 Tax=Cryobacterium sp. PAMC25264 TaxID=2861288 RepID=UPI001C62EB45|nr:M1 family metallopeptidase [Cryobacterium sp. PAMC25264]QYF72482.1 M1 family metallopeptidase [Cryobacterium sp. PAMC25264]
MLSPTPPIVGSTSAGDPYLPASGNGGYQVEHYDLVLDYRVSSNRLTATATITARALTRLDRFSLDLAGLSVDKVTVAGRMPTKTTHTARKLVLTPAVPLQPGERFDVVVVYRGAPHPVRSHWGELGWEELTDGVLVAGQPSGAPSWFPCNDHPSDKATFRIQLSCEAPYTVVSNGPLVAKSSRSGRTTWTFEVREPMAAYLASVQIGRYRRQDVTATPVAYSLFYPPALARPVSVDFTRLGDMISVFGEAFGPYPFPAFSVIVTADELEIPLEAHGLAVFGRNHVDGLHGSDRLIAHELAHQWFGNSLTLTRWADIWLHEGFACYAEWIWAEASGGPTAHESALLHRAEVDLLPKNIVVGDPGPQDMFDDRVYKRGALALHAVRQAIGDEAFFTALRAYTRTHRHGSVTTDDLLGCFDVASGTRVADKIIARWVSGKSLPPLAA